MASFINPNSSPHQKNKNILSDTCVNMCTSANNNCEYECNRAIEQNSAERGTPLYVPFDSPPFSAPVINPPFAIPNHLKLNFDIFDGTN